MKTSNKLKKLTKKKESEFYAALLDLEIEYGIDIMVIAVKIGDQCVCECVGSPKEVSYILGKLVETTLERLSHL